MRPDGAAPASPPAMRSCRVCGNSDDNAEFVAREMMFGSRDTFRYLECGACGCLQIIDPPSDLSPYYPDSYYSFQQIPGDNPVKRYLKRKRAVYALTGRSLFGGVLVRKYGFPIEMTWAKHAGLDFDDAVLDVGCGAGLNLLQMATAGFKVLHGVDPYIPHDYRYPNGVVISKRKLAEVTGAYDFVMFHHSFEHMSEPADVLGHVHRLLRPDRFTLLRMPVAQSCAWREYGADWVQLDPPRHLMVYSEKAVSILADQCGFVLEDVVYDSTGFQFWGSEQYQQDVPLFDQRSVASNAGSAAMFSEAELRDFDARAAVLNTQRDGDQACFYLRKRAA